MSKKFTFYVVVLVVLANLIFAQTTGRGIILETITDPEATLGQPEIKFQTGHNVNAVRWNPSGKNFITIGGADCTVKLWDSETGRLLETFFHSSYVGEAAFNSDGTILATSSHDCTVKIWDIKTKENIKVINFPYLMGGTLKFSQDGNFLLAYSVFDTCSFIYDIKKDIISGTYDNKCSDFTNDFKIYAYVSNGSIIKILDIEKNLELLSLDNMHHVDKLRLSPDGRILVVYIYNYMKNVVMLFDVKTGTKISTFDSFDGFSPENNSCLVYDNGEYVLFDLISNKNLYTFTDCSFVKFISNSTFLVSSDDGNTYLLDIEKEEKKWIINYSFCSFDYFDINVKKVVSNNSIIDLESRKKIKFIYEPRCVDLVSFELINETLITYSSPKIISNYDLKTGKLINTNFDLPFEDVGYYKKISPDGKLLSVYDRVKDLIILWDINKSMEIWSYQIQDDDPFMTFSPNNKIFAFFDNKKTQLFDVYSGKLLDTFDISGNVMAFNSDGKILAIGSRNMIFFLMDKQMERICLSENSNVNTLAFSPDSKNLLIGTLEGEVFIIDIRTGLKTKTFLDENFIPAAYIDTVVFTSDGKTISANDMSSSIRLWDVDTRNKKDTSLDNHSGMIRSISFSPDSKYLVSGGADGTVKLWNVETGELIYTIINGKDGEWLTYTPEGFFTGSEWATKNLVHIVDGLEVIGIDQVYDKLYRPDLVAAKMRGEDISMYAKEVNLASLVRSGSVPVVTLKNIPENPTSRDITFNVCVKNTGGGIGKVNLVLNGKTIQLSEGIESSIGQTVNFRHTITLQNGENTIEAFAYNGSGLVESRRPSSIISWEGKTTKPNLYVLTLAINKYRDKSLWLNYCVPDANAIAESFKSQESGLYENVYVSSLQDGEVTKEEIREEFKRLSNLVTADDVFVFYISGHGTTYDDGDYYYLPVNIRYTSREEIPIQGVSKNDLIENLSLIKAGKTLLMLDTCNSGAFFADSGQRGLSEKTAIDRLTRATGHATLAASSDSQSAMEGYEGHGVFTYVLLEGLKGEADSNDDGFVTLLELASYVENEVPERSYEKWGYEQVPQKDLRRQDFPIAGK